jgi:hypothetical protein
MTNPAPLTTREWAEMHCERAEDHLISDPGMCPCCGEPLTNREESDECFICHAWVHQVCTDAIRIGHFFESVCDNCNPLAAQKEADENEQSA